MKSYVLSYWILMIFTKKERQRKRKRERERKKECHQLRKYKPGRWTSSQVNLCTKSRRKILSKKSLVTLITWKWLLSSVYSLMPCTSKSFGKTLVTLITCKWPFPSVYSLMLCKSRSFGKTLVTLIT